MSFDITVEEEGLGVLVTFKGNVLGRDMLAANEDIYSRDHNCLYRYQIWDLSGADSMKMSEEEIRATAFQDLRASKKNPDQIVAIIGSDGLFGGIDKRFSIYSEVWSGFRSETFHTMEEARIWIQSLI